MLFIISFTSIEPPSATYCFSSDLRFLLIISSLSAVIPEVSISELPSVPNVVMTNCGITLLNIILSFTFPQLIVMSALTLPAAPVVASILLKLLTTTLTPVTSALLNASFTLFVSSSCVSSLLPVMPLTVASTTALASATFSASVFGNWLIVLLSTTLSLAFPQLIVISALTLPAALVVAFCISSSPTVALASVIPAFFKASSIIF